MTYSLKRVVAPDDDVVTRAQAKAHLRVDDDDNDALIDALIDAATEMIDGAQGFLGRALMVQTWDYFLESFPVYGNSATTFLGTGAAPYSYSSSCGFYAPYINIPLPPLLSVTGVYYRDNAGNEQTVNSANYNVVTNTEPGKIYLPNGGSWPTSAYGPGAVRIRFKAGVLDADDIPKSIKAAILIYVADLYENRESMIIGDTVNKLPWSAEQLLRRHRFDLGMA